MRCPSQASRFSTGNTTVTRPAAVQKVLAEEIGASWELGLGVLRSRIIATSLRETPPRDLRHAPALRRLPLATAMLYRYGEWGSYESSHSTAIFTTRLYLGFSRRYRARAASGLAFSHCRRSGDPPVLVYHGILNHPVE